jgi:nucleotide-binding universal stress UspA family protein
MGGRRLKFGIFRPNNEEDHRMFKKLLVPVDGSSHSSRAVDLAVELAKCHGSSVLLLHVIRDLSLPKEILEMIKAGEVTASRMEILEDSADIILGNAREKFEKAGLSGIKSEFLMGDPASMILEYAEQNDVDLIVIGHRGLGPHEGLLGGVARKLVNMTRTSCLIAT